MSFVARLDYTVHTVVSYYSIKRFVINLVVNFNDSYINYVFLFCFFSHVYISTTI
jgi:hypothetical protein